MEFLVLVLRKGTRAPNGHPWVAKPSQGQGRGMGFAKGCLKQARGQMARKYCDTSGRRVVESLILCNVTQVATTWSHSNHEAIPRPRAENGICEWIGVDEEPSIAQDHAVPQGYAFPKARRRTGKMLYRPRARGVQDNNLSIPTRREQSRHPHSETTRSSSPLGRDGPEAVKEGSTTSRNVSLSLSLSPS